MTRLKLNICPLTILFAEIFFSAVIGGTIIVIFYTEGMGAKYYEKGCALISYMSILYASLVMAVISCGLKIRRRLLSYAIRTFIAPSRSILSWCWCATFFVAFGCFIWVLAQAGMKHPIISALLSDNSVQVADIRSTIAKTIDMRVYNVGFMFCLPLNLIISVFLLRNILFSVVSVSLLILLGTFTLAKAPIAYVLIFLLMFRMLYSPLYLKTAFKYLSIIILSLILLFMSTRYADVNARSVIKSIGDRILYGAISDLPYYFEVFSEERVNLKSLMPPYMVGDQKSAARIVAEYSVEKMFSRLPSRDKEEKEWYSSLGGGANTFFTGEAFAWIGYLGVILSPLIIMAHLAFFLYLFDRIKKTWLSVFVFSFLLYKVFVGIFGGISYFIVSSMHIISMGFLLLLVFLRYLENKNIPFLRKIAETLCIL